MFGKKSEGELSQYRSLLVENVHLTSVAKVSELNIRYHINLACDIYLYIHINVQWCRGVVVKHADSQHKGCHFNSSMCHF